MFLLVVYVSLREDSCHFLVGISESGGEKRKLVFESGWKTLDLPICESKYDKYK